MYKSYRNPWPSTSPQDRFPSEAWGLPWTARTAKHKIRITFLFIFWVEKKLFVDTDKDEDDDNDASFKVDNQLASSLHNTPAAWAQCYKTFVTHNLQIFVISWSVCHWWAFPVHTNKHSSLVRKSVNHGQKRFYNIGPAAHCHKTFFVRNLQIFVIG